MASGTPQRPLVQVAIHPADAPAVEVVVAHGEVAAGPEAIDGSDFATGYTGKHDHGELPPQDTNEYTAALRALQHAKDLSDAHLQRLQADEKKMDASQQPMEKKARSE